MTAHVVAVDEIEARNAAVQGERAVSPTMRAGGVAEAAQAQRAAGAVTARPLWRQVWGLAWPAITHMLLITLVFTSARAMVGRYSSTALAAMQICGTLSWAVYSIFGAASAGTLAVVARRVGAGDRASAAAAARASMLFAVAVGAVVTAPILIANGSLLRLLFPRAGAEVIEQADAYLHVVLPAMPLAFLEAAAAASLQGAGDTRTPLAVGVIGCVVNVALSALLIFGALGLPELGLRGAAIGTAAAMALEGAALSAALLSRSSPLPIRGSRSRGNDAPLARVLRVAAPAFAERLSYQAGYIGYVGIIGLLGAAAMASNQALVSIEAVCFLSADGFGVAAAALLAQKLGAGRHEEASRAGLLATLMATLLLSAFGLAFFAAPGALMRAFSSDPDIVSLGARALYVAAVAQPFMAAATVLGAALRGAGDTRTVLAVTLICSLGVRLGATWTFAVTLDHGLVGVWMGSTADWVCRSALLGAAYARGRWRRVAV